MKRNWYYWIIANDMETGQPWVATGGPSEEAARKSGIELLGNMEFEIRRLPTINITTARGMIRYDRYKKTKSFSEAMRRQGHEKTIDRRIKKLRHKRLPSWL